MNFKILQPRQNNTSLIIIIIMIFIITTMITSTFTSIIIYFNSGDQFSKRGLNLDTMPAFTQQTDTTYSSAKAATNYEKTSKQISVFLRSIPIIDTTIYLLKLRLSNLNTIKIENDVDISQLRNWRLAYSPFYKNSNHKQIETVEINFNTHTQITPENNSFILIMGIFISVITILAIIGWVLLNSHITKPIINITKIITDISSIEDINQYTVNSNNNNDEINQLNLAINNMLLKLGISFSELKDKLSKNTIELQENKKELEESEKHAIKLANQLKTLAFTSKVILSTPNLDTLLPRVAAAISETLSFYHIGIFLLDDAKEYAILTATNSLGGQKMIERNHRLKVGEEGIVGYAAGSARPRIAHNTDKDSIFLINTDLPETRSELAMPLKIGLSVIGILDVQSKEHTAFTEEDIEFFSILGDYISIAIQNAQRFQEIQKNITESDTLYRNYLRQEWKSFANQRRNLGYLYNISGSKPITKKSESTEIQKAIQSGKPTISQEKNQSHLSVPIKLRGQVIGILNIQAGGNHAWEEDEVDIATAIADRVGLAVENARLLEDSQSRAARERTISEITSKIGASINIRNVLQTAVEELGHTLPGSDVIIQLKDTKNKE